MNSIKVGFVDYWRPMPEFFTSLLSKKYEVERCDSEPDYLFFCDHRFGKSNLGYDESKVKKIFFTGENERPSSYRAKFSACFDHMDDPNHYRLPLYVVDEWMLSHRDGLPSLDSVPPPAPREKFCAFVAGNGACSERNNAFHKISSYKGVDSFGPLFNNTGYRVPFENHASGYSKKLNIFGEYKFSLCYENGSHPGYVTEKLYHGLYAGTVPIYWGSPCVGLDFNTRRFVSRHDFASDQDMLDYIVHLDSDDEAYRRVVSEPVWPEGVRPRWANLHNFSEWFDKTVRKK